MSREKKPTRDEVFSVSDLLMDYRHASQATDESIYEGMPRIPHQAVRGLLSIAKGGDVTIGELATRLGCSAGWASRVVDDLEQHGLVQRNRDESDRRVVRIGLSPAADQMIDTVYERRGQVVATALGALDPAGREAVQTFLRRLTEELRRKAPG